MKQSSHFLAAGAAIITVMMTGLLTSSPAEAQWRGHGWHGHHHGFHHHGFWRHGFFPYRYGFYPRPIIYPRPVVYAPVFVPPPPPPPPVYATYAPPPVVYAKPYRKRVTHRHYRKASKRPACNCPAQPATAPAPAPATGS